VRVEARGRPHLLTKGRRTALERLSLPTVFSSIEVLRLSQLCDPPANCFRMWKVRLKEWLMSFPPRFFSSPFAFRSLLLPHIATPSLRRSCVAASTWSGDCPLSCPRTLIPLFFPRASLALCHFDRRPRVLEADESFSQREGESPADVSFLLSSVSNWL